ncbi:MAG: hypothetical protein CMF31_00875 [Kordiimonas sp.]|nr:hypothetical protein [Kordiimonas sp.]|tara:strand:- start:2089 stop:4380 length:2292 start_codon:yes stop_codon:yes gene_type:complete
MISDISLIRNVGRFDSVSSGANIPFEKFTFVYGENGRGKTTISSILKSLGTNEASLVLERHRLGATHPPHIVINSSQGQHQFQNSQWNTGHNDVVVFDDNFVAQNVCSGIEVDNAHCKNLHELIVGAQGVSLNATLQAAIKEVEEHNTTLRTLGSNIPANIRGQLNIDQFCSLEVKDNIDQLVEEAEKKIAAAKAAAQIQNQKTFVNFSLPEFDVESLNKLLEKNLPDLEVEAAEQVQEHISSIGKNGESWIADGIVRIDAVIEATGDNDCPFCAQSLEKSTVITHYQSYFSEAYKNLREEITGTGKSLSKNFGDNIPAAYERAIAGVNEAKNFWSKFVDIPEVTFDTAETVRALNAAREAVRAQLLEKFSAPFEKGGLSEDCRTLIAAYEDIRALHMKSFSVVLGLNTQLEVIKEQSASSDLSALQSDLQKLLLVKIRHSDPAKTNCENYLAAQAAKKVSETARDAARTALNTYQEQVFPQYEQLLNTYLTKFNAGYRLGSITKRNTRAGATCDYKVLINNNEVALNSSDGPSFKNTLSAGDRNSLALAFFFASLELDPNLSSKIVVIDDPMTSLDEHRSLTTRQEIRALVDKVAQVVVLSHEKRFLCGLWDAAERINRTAILVEREGSGSTISLWNVSDDCVTEHDRRYQLVANFIDNYERAQERNVAVALRYILEAFVRVAYPVHFPPGSLLGRFVDTCRRHQGQATEILSSSDAIELRALLDYANKFHHDTNLAYETEQINDIELENFARRTLNFSKKS